MSDYTIEEIDTAVGDVEDWDELCDDYYYRYRPKRSLTLRSEEIPVKHIDGRPPAEGGGEYIWAVIQVGTQYFKKTGFYASQGGAYWDGATVEVHPVERITTFYE